MKAETRDKSRGVHAFTIGQCLMFNVKRNMKDEE